ncbi:MAG: hypothetical protein J6C23_08255 [Clostridia bacterium]|nr:hypothetical protein [Clostridia bacterium]
MRKPIEKADYERSYQSARWDIMLLIALTVINIGITLFTNESGYISAAAIPMFLVRLGKIMCGKMDNAFYEKNYPDIEFMDNSFMVWMIVAAVVIIGIYVLLWFLSQKYTVPLIIAGALILIDTVSMFFIYTDAFDFFRFCDYAIHAIMIVMIAIGVHAGFKLKKIRADEEAFMASIHMHRDQFANRR